MKKSIPLTLKEIYFLMHPGSVKSRAGDTLDKIAANRILCLSDTPDTSIYSESLAITLAQKLPQRSMTLVQSDIQEPSARHFPLLSSIENLKPAHSYQKINNETYSPTSKEKYDLILARHTICFCKNYLSCGGIAGNSKAITHFFESSILANQPKMAILTANYLEEYAPTLKIYRDGRQLTQDVCAKLANRYPEYEFIFVGKFTDLYFCPDPDAEPGHAIILVRRNTGLEITERNQETMTYPVELEQKEVTGPSPIKKELLDWFANRARPIPDSDSIEEAFLAPSASTTPCL